MTDIDPEMTTKNIEAIEKTTEITRRTHTDTDE